MAVQEQSLNQPVLAVKRKAVHTVEGVGVQVRLSSDRCKQEPSHLRVAEGLRRRFTCTTRQPQQMTPAAHLQRRPTHKSVIHDSSNHSPGFVRRQVVADGL